MGRLALTIVFAYVANVCTGRRIYATSAEKDVSPKRKSPVAKSVAARDQRLSKISQTSKSRLAQFLLAVSPAGRCCNLGRPGGLARHRSLRSRHSRPSMTMQSRSPPKNFLEDIQTEAELGRRAQLVELPVMFTDESDGRSFEFDRWEMHRSGSRYWRLLLGILFGPTSRHIAMPIAALGIFTGLVELYSHWASNNPMLPELYVPLTPFELTAPVLGLLLVFRTNGAYERFDRGSDESWQLTNRFRTIMRQIAVVTSGPDVSEHERQAGREIIDACLLLHGWFMDGYLRGHHDSDYGEKFLTLAMGDQFRSPLAKGLTPAAATTALSVAIARRLPKNDIFLNIDMQTSFLMSSLTICEKLLRTPIPLGYTRYSVRFLWAWLTLLPFALIRTYTDFGVGTWWEDKPSPILVLTMTFIAFLFLSIEDIAVQIEEPFTVLPLEKHQTWLDNEAEQIKALFFDNIVDPLGIINSTASQHPAVEDGMIDAA